MEFHDYIAALGIDPETMTAQTQIALQAAWRAGGTPGSSLHAPMSGSAADADRVAAIRAMCGPDTLTASEAIAGGWDLPRTKMKMELNAVRASRMSGPISTVISSGDPTGPSSRRRHGPQPTKQNALLQASLMIRAGHYDAAVAHFGTAVAHQGEDLGLRSLVDAAKFHLAASGRPDVPNATDGIVNLALRAEGPSTYSFANALADTVGRVVSHIYETVPATWVQFCAKKPLKDFRPQTGVRPSYYADLLKVAEGGEIQHANADDKATYKFNLDTYARMFAVTRHTLINDDLGILDQLPLSMGRGAARALASLIYTTLAANAGSFFGTANKNLMAGGGSALSITSLATAVQKMREQKSLEGDYLSIAPTTLLVPPALEVTALQVLNSTQLYRTADQAPMGNPFANSQINLAVEPRLTSPEWYLFGPMSAESVVVGFLDGKDTPTIESSTLDFDQLGAQFRCYHDFAAALADPTGAVRSAGA